MGRHIVIEWSILPANLAVVGVHSYGSGATLAHARACQEQAWGNTLCLRATASARRIPGVCARGIAVLVFGVTGVDTVHRDPTDRAILPILIERKRN